MYQTVEDVLPTSSATEEIVVTSQGQGPEVMVTTLPHSAGDTMPAQIIVTTAPKTSAVVVSRA